MSPCMHSKNIENSIPTLISDGLIFQENMQHMRIPYIEKISNFSISAHMNFQ